MRALLPIALATIVLMAFIRLAGALFAGPLTAVFGGGERGFTLAQISASVVGEAAFLAVILLAYRAAKRPPLEPRSLAWGRPLGWLLTIVVTCLWVSSVTLEGPLRSEPVLEMSGFNFLGSAMAGLAGSFEEVLCRGILISFLARRGFGTWTQVLWSALFFGLAHVGWGIVAGEADFAAAMAAIIATGILGLALGAIFVAAGRCLTPVIAAHAMINVAVEPWLFLSLVASQV